MCECQFGYRTVPALAIPNPGVGKDSLALTKELCDRLLISEELPPLKGVFHGNRLQIGPVVGILCNPVWSARQHTLVTNGQLPVLRKLLSAGAAAGALCYLFRVDDVQFQTLTVKGYVQGEDGAWKERVLPLPDVIYDQVISRRRERRQSHSKVRERLSKMYGSRIFNDGFLDKWEVHEWLQRDPRVRQHVPRTIRYSTVKTAAAFCERYPVTFLKPVHGSLGLGIVRLTRQPDGSIQYDLKRPRQAPLHGRAANVREALRVLSGRLASRPYVVQQGIPLCTYQERPFDIRILLQRDGAGEWQRTKMFARVAKSGDFTSNLSSGGEALPVHKVFTEVFSKAHQARSCQRDITRISKWVVEALERESGKVFGEVGLDIGVDSEGRVWVIEVNSKPWKKPFTEKGRQDLVDLSFSRPIAYAIWLAQKK
jgi:glutathione synthase/RimK-type ligase-like ATP-grasp enzyme